MNTDKHGSRTTKPTTTSPSTYVVRPDSIRKSRKLESRHDVVTPDTKVTVKQYPAFVDEPRSQHADGSIPKSSPVQETAIPDNWLTALAGTEISVVDAAAILHAFHIETTSTKKAVQKQELKRDDFENLEVIDLANLNLQPAQQGKVDYANREYEKVFKLLNSMTWFESENLFKLKQRHTTGGKAKNYLPISALGLFILVNFGPEPLASLLKANDASVDQDEKSLKSKLQTMRRVVRQPVTDNVTNDGEESLRYARLVLLSLSKYFIISGSSTFAAPNETSNKSEGVDHIWQLTLNMLEPILVPASTVDRTDRPRA